MDSKQLKALDYKEFQELIKHAGVIDQVAYNLVEDIDLKSEASLCRKWPELSNQAKQDVVKSLLHLEDKELFILLRDRILTFD